MSDTGTLAAVSTPPISFARGAPAPDLIPAAELAACAFAVAQREGAKVFSYGPGGGYGPLREWVAELHAVEPSRVVLTVGGLLGFVLYAAEQRARRPGRVLVEGPSYDRPLKVLARESAEVVALPMDEEGLVPEALEAELRRDPDPPSFLYTIPTFQNPSGRTLSVERRRRIVDIASDHRLPVLEDDPYGLVRYEGEPHPTLYELEGGELVTYTSSFSKTVAPGLRTGYFVLPWDDAGGFEERAVSTYISPPFHAQATIAEFIASGRFEPNLVRVCTSLRERRDAMLQALERSFPDGASWNRPEGGYFLWLELGGEVSASDLAARAESAGVAIVRGEDFFPTARVPGLSQVPEVSQVPGVSQVPEVSQAPPSPLGASSARLAFSYEPPERIVEGIERLAALLR